MHSEPFKLGMPLSVIHAGGTGATGRFAVPFRCTAERIPCTCGFSILIGSIFARVFGEHAARLSRPSFSARERFGKHVTYSRTSIIRRLVGWIGNQLLQVFSCVIYIFLSLKYILE